MLAMMLLSSVSIQVLSLISSQLKDGRILKETFTAESQIINLVILATVVSVA